MRAVADEVGATPAQIALAWLLAQGDDIAPIPGTRRVARVEENTAVDAITLTADQLGRLNDLTPAAGKRRASVQRYRAREPSGGGDVTVWLRWAATARYGGRGLSD